MTIQVPSVSSTSMRVSTSDSSHFDGSAKHKDLGSSVQSTSELKHLERTGSKITVGDEQMVKMVEHALKALQGPHTSAELSVHEGTNAIMIKIINSDTGEMIREIPSEKSLDIVAKLLEVNGLLVDTRV